MSFLLLRHLYCFCSALTRKRLFFLLKEMEIRWSGPVLQCDQPLVHQHRLNNTLLALCTRPNLHNPQPDASQQGNPLFPSTLNPTQHEHHHHITCRRSAIGLKIFNGIVVQEKPRISLRHCCRNIAQEHLTIRVWRAVANISHEIGLGPLDWLCLK